MKSGVKILLCALFVTLPVAAIAQAPENQIEMVKRIEAIRVAALISADGAVLARIFAPDATYIHSNGLVQTPDQLIETLARNEVRYVSINVENVRYRVYDGVVVGTGVQQLEVESGERMAMFRSRFTVVYAGAGMDMKMIAYQSTSTPAITPAE